MFYGVALKPGQATTLSPQDGGEVLHLSQACMPQPKEGGKVYVQVTQDGKSYYVCMLQKDHQESQQLDLFLSTRQGLSLKTEGAKNEVHLTGYFEPASEMVDSDEEDSDEEEVAGEFLQTDAGAIKHHTPKKGGKVEDLDAAGDEDDDDDDDDDDDETAKMKALTEGLDEDEDDDDEDDDDDDEDEVGANGVAGESASDDEEDDDEEERAAPQQHLSSSNEKKRKAQENSSGGAAAAGADAKKKAKTGPQQGGQQQKQQKQQQQKGSGGGDAGAYKNALIEYLKKNGKTPLATLGQKVKKPAGVSEKMAQFLKSHASVFEVSNGVCALKA